MAEGYILNFDLDQTFIVGGQYVAGQTYTSSIDNLYFGVNVGGVHVINFTPYTSSIDNLYFGVNVGGTVIPKGYTETISQLQSLTGTKNQTNAYIYTIDTGQLQSLTGTKNQTNAYIYTIDTGNLLSSNLVGLKNTQALPVYIQFSSAIPYVRLNIPSNVPFLKQVFVE